MDKKSEIMELTGGDIPKLHKLLPMVDEKTKEAIHRIIDILVFDFNPEEFDITARDFYKKLLGKNMFALVDKGLIVSSNDENYQRISDQDDIFLASAKWEEEFRAPFVIDTEGPDDCWGIYIDDLKRFIQDKFPNTTVCRYKSRHWYVHPKVREYPLSRGNILYYSELGWDEANDCLGCLKVLHEYAEWACEEN